MLKVQIADSPHALSKGLMFVQELPMDEGMLFIFPRAHTLNFWGQNTFIPLDIAFVDDKNCIKKIAKIQPHSLRAVSSDCLCNMAIEANEGYFEDIGVHVGDKVMIDRGSQGDMEDKFAKQFAITRDWDRGFVTFAKEGQSHNREKDINSVNPNIKESQVLPPPDEMKVKKPDMKDKDVIGKPIPGPMEADGVEQDNNLPVVGPDDLPGYIEDFQQPADQTESTQPMGNGPDSGIPQQPEELDENNTGPEIPEEPAEPGETEEYPQFSNPYQALNWASKNDEVVRIKYVTKHGTNLVRDVEPHGMVHSESTYRELLVTFDETVGDIRAFILSNIKEWAFLKRKFSRKFVVRA